MTPSRPRFVGIKVHPSVARKESVCQNSARAIERVVVTVIASTNCDDTIGFFIGLDFLECQWCYFRPYLHVEFKFEFKCIQQKCIHNKERYNRHNYSPIGTPVEVGLVKLDSI